MIERADFRNPFGSAQMTRMLLTCTALLLASGCSVFDAQEKVDSQPIAQLQAAPEAPEAEPEPEEEPERPVREILAEAITFESLGDTLSGVIERPDTRQAPGPAVLILHATGPHDRRGHFKTGLGVQLPVEVAVYEDIAQHLVKNGYMVMRFDKRTCVKGGRPWCTYPRAYVESHRSELAEALEADAAAAVAKLRTDPRVDPTQIFIIGHGQGADLALALSPKVNPAGLLLLAPSPYPIDQIISHQIDTSLKHLQKEREKAGNTTEGTLLAQQTEELQKTQTLQSEGFAALRAGDFDQDELLGAPAKTWSGFFALHQRASAQLSQTSAPILAIFGSHDGVLPRGSARAFEEKTRPANAEDAETGSVDIVELPKTTHFMIDIDVEADPSSVSDAVQQQVLDFLDAQSETRD
ncbi:alpha/beta hydrolase [Bradymonas sediminis]|uniref:Uncharacterized protein n=1 Tax=Bradymonas sediminis TaxID=1548548 RepID=A0A2Z4FGM4_9DELT|nr:alpha/beta hydrolase [Bradymonas sediminis]AWV88089.1 hypothetical protein DN745_01570 [Bradymonas sediminis]TDP77212.1 alpha-beta hydrolase superfamily lysophospholipase [Bradymonas sediminis]